MDRLISLTLTPKASPRAFIAPYRKTLRGCRRLLCLLDPTRLDETPIAFGIWDFSGITRALTLSGNLRTLWLIMGNTFGQLFRITTWGESHGAGVGVVIDGCPPRLALTEADIQPDLDRRRPGQSKIVSPRKEADKVQILSGTFEGKTLGTPISLLVKNEDARPEAYSEIATKFRPSHADYTYQTKYGIRNRQGGGRTSAR